MEVPYLSVSDISDVSVNVSLSKAGQGGAPQCNPDNPLTLASKPLSSNDYVLIFFALLLAW